MPHSVPLMLLHPTQNSGRARDLLKIYRPRSLHHFASTDLATTRARPIHCANLAACETVKDSIAKIIDGICTAEQIWRI